MKKQKGITLIALVITIIVLLILAGVSINMISGDDGIVSRASAAKEKTIIAEDNEKINLTLSEYKLLKASSSTQTLEELFESKEWCDSVTLEENTMQVVMANGNEYEIPVSSDLNSTDRDINTIGLYEAGDYIYTRNIVSGNELGAQTIEEGKKLAKEMIEMDTGMSWEDFLAMITENGATEDMLWAEMGLTEESFEPSIFDGGWRVSINYLEKDRNQTSYGPILESIYDIPVVDMSSTFSGCENLIAIPEIPKTITDMSNTFQSCTSLTNVNDLVIPEGVTNMNATFSRCYALTDASGLIIPDTVTNMHAMFYGCKALTKAPELSKGAIDVGYAFFECRALITPPSRIPSSVENMEEMFLCCMAMQTVPDMSDAVNVTNMRSTFASCESIDAFPVIPPKVINLQSTFVGCKLVTTLPEGFTIPDTVTNMKSTFRNCSLLTEAPIIPNSVKDMNMTFMHCKALSGTITINANPEIYEDCLYNTNVTDIIGQTTMKNELIATKAAS